MKAVRFNVTIPRYALGQVLGRISPRLLWSGLSCTFVEEVPAPRLPAEDWVVVKTRYGGICGSDLGAIHLHNSPYFTPLTSLPYTFGHENMGTLAQVGAEAGDWEVGQRVVVEPILWCQPRGFKDLCRFCARGEINLCERLAEGELAPAMMTGYSRDTGGSWSPYFLAHKSQVYPVPEDISDENALMVEPFAVGLHAALQNYPADDERVLIIGSGSIGLCTLAALRVLGSQADIHVLARHPFQAEAARKLGASGIIPAGGGNDYYREIADLTEARLYQAMLGKRVMIGGFDRTFDCVGSSGSLDDSLRLTRSRGKVSVVGVPGIAKGVDWTAIFTKELVVEAALFYNHAETYNGKQWEAFELVLDFMAKSELDLGWLVTHKFALEDYDQAFDLLMNKKQNHTIKAVFEFK